MMGMKLWIRELMLQRRWRRRFPLSVVHRGASLSDDSDLGDYAVLFPGANLHSSRIGQYSYLQSGVAALNADIGPFCSIASGVIIGLAAHPTSLVSTSPVFYDNRQPLPKFLTTGVKFSDTLPRTIVGADVWMGQGAMVKAGVIIGVGSIIGAGAIVTRDVPPYAIVAGNPCRLIRQRFSDQICRGLLATQWWSLEPSRLEELAHLFADPPALLAAMAERSGGD